MFRIRGTGYIALNAIRVLNIISLLMVAIASWVMLVMNIKTSTFYFFDSFSHVVTSGICIFLFISEVSLFKSYFHKRWPSLSNDSGFVFLGLAMVTLGFNILGNLNKPATSVSNLGLPCWRIVIASGITTSVMGFFNIVATYVFCDSAQGITGRQVRSHGASIAQNSHTRPFKLSSEKDYTLPQYESAKGDNNRSSIFGFRLPIRKGPVMSQIFRSNSEPASDPALSSGHPEPHTSDNPHSRQSPIVPEIQRPPTALHPLHADRGYPASSRYSVVSDVTRF